MTVGDGDGVGVGDGEGDGVGEGEGVGEGVGVGVIGIPRLTVIVMMAVSDVGSSPWEFLPQKRNPRKKVKQKMNVAIFFIVCRPLRAPEKLKKILPVE